MRTNTMVPQVGLAALREQLDQVIAAAPELLPAKPKRERAARPPAKAAPHRDLRVGDLVEVTRLGQRGTIASATAGREEVEVQVGALRMRARRSDLRLVQAAENIEERPAAAAGVRLMRAEGPAPSIEVDMRGWRADEVAPELERYVHDAYMANMPFVRIIHGKGTGTLRQVVRDELATNPFVASFRTAPANEGGDGVTVVELNKT
jgi:DNA mismatch repair protein MutS2